MCGDLPLGLQAFGCRVSLTINHLLKARMQTCLGNRLFHCVHSQILLCEAILFVPHPTCINTSLSGREAIVSRGQHQVGFHQPAAMWMGGTPGRKAQITAELTQFWEVSKNEFLDLNEHDSELTPLFFSKGEMGYICGNLL